MSRQEIWIGDSRHAGGWGESGEEVLISFFFFIFFFSCFEWFRGHHGHLGEIGPLIHDICIYIHWSDFSISRQGLFPTARLRDLRPRLPQRDVRPREIRPAFFTFWCRRDQKSRLSRLIFPRPAHKNSERVFFFVAFNWFRTVQSCRSGPGNGPRPPESKIRNSFIKTDESEDAKVKLICRCTCCEFLIRPLMETQTDAER